MAYTGTSIVDYLKSTGQDSSYGARSNLASQYGITNYTGSGEQNLELLNKLQSNTGSVPTITQPKTLETSNTAQTPTNDLLTKALAELQSRITPINVSDITQDKTIPDKALETSYNKTSTTSADSISSLIAKQDEKLQAEKASAQSALSKAGLTGAGNTLQEQLITGYQTKAPQADYQGTLQQYQSQYGVIDALDEYKLQGEKVVQMKAAVENLDLQRQAELDATLNRQASMNSISAEQQRINQKYDSQRAKLVGDYNVEAAVLAAKSNNLSEANNLVSQAVNAYTADISAEIKRFDNLYSIASDWVSSLTSQEQSILDDVKSNLITQKKDEEERLNNVLNLKLQYPGAGIESTDTIEQATAKAEKIAEQDRELDIVYKTKQLEELGSSSDIKLTDSQIVTGSQKARMTIDEFKNLSLEDQAWFLTGRYESALESITDDVLSSGIADAYLAFQNDPSIPQVIKNSLSKDVSVYAKSLFDNQTITIPYDKNAQVITIFDESNGKTSTLFGNKEEKSEWQDMNAAAKALGYGVWYTGGGAQRENLVANIMNWIDGERAKMKSDVEIFKEIKSYLTDAKNGTVTADNPFIKY